MPSTFSVRDSTFHDRFLAARQRTRALFDLIDPDAYYAQPIALRHPIVFYDGHLSAFAINTLIKRTLHRSGIDAGFERLFARGIDPDSHASAPAGNNRWPPRDAVRAYSDEADALIARTLTEDFDHAGDPLLDRAEAAFTVIEHELMHQETLLYIVHRLPYDLKKRPRGYAPDSGARGIEPHTLHIPRGEVTLGADRKKIPFGWDNEFPEQQRFVDAFALDATPVTNGEFLEFVDAGGYERSTLWDDDARQWLATSGTKHPPFWEQERSGEWFCRGMFDRLPLPLDWPVYVTYAEASAYARWRSARLPTEAEFHRAAYGSPEGERKHPWGEDDPAPQLGNFGFTSWDPRPVGCFPAGASAWGVHELVGNGWEWTSSLFAPFPGFRPMASYPEYSVDFFDGEHYVMKGASPATDTSFIRRSFRNWFRPTYPYMYAKFRCVR